MERGYELEMGSRCLLSRQTGAQQTGERKASCRPKSHELDDLLGVKAAKIKAHRAHGLGSWSGARKEEVWKAVGTTHDNFCAALKCPLGSIRHGLDGGHPTRRRANYL